MVIALVALLALFATSAASHASVGLGAADGFALLAGQSVTNTGATTITGDLGVHPGATNPPDNVSGFDSITLNGTLHDGDAVAQQAKDDLVTAYNDAAGRTPDDDPGTELGGQTLTGGVYGSDTFEITGTLTLDAEGDPDTTWVFQASSTLLATPNSRVELANDADPCNVFWQVGSSATLDTDAEMVGTIMALTSITLNTGATVQGRVLARNGSVTLDNNTITNEGCTTASDTDSDDDATDDDATDDDTTTGDDDTTTGDDDTTTGDDDTTTGDDDSTTGDDDSTTGDDDTTSQVTEVPSGAVAAGGRGIDASPNGSHLLLASAFLLVAAGGTVAVRVRRRVRG